MTSTWGLGVPLLPARTHTPSRKFTYGHNHPPYTNNQPTKTLFLHFSHQENRELFAKLDSVELPRKHRDGLKVFMAVLAEVINAHAIKP